MHIFNTGGSTLIRLRAGILALALLAAGGAPCAPEKGGEPGYLKLHAEAMRNAAARPGNRRLLVLNSYNAGYDWTDNEVEAVSDAFGDDPKTVIQMEYMDAKLLNTPDYFRQLRDLMAKKFDKTQFDAIIATDDDAINFLREYRDTLFPGTPVVFCGANDFNPESIKGFPNATGVNEAADFVSNLDLILRLHPGVRQIYVISDDLTAGLKIQEEFLAASKAFEDRVQFEFLTGLTLDQLVQRVATLPSDSVIFYLTFFRDAAGDQYTPWEAIPPISHSASVPMYGQVDYMLGKGIVGGRVKSSYYQGRAAVDLVRRVLDGEPAGDIPVVMDSPNHYIFDYQQMQRFGIPIAELPDGSSIINEPHTFYYKYKTLIWTVAGIILLLLGFIVVLLFNIRKRVRAQMGLEDIIGAMGSMLELGSPAKIRDELVRAIRRVIFLDRRIEHAAFFNYTGDFNAFDPEALEQLDPLPDGTAPANQTLIRRAIEEGRCIVARRECVALFQSGAIPANVVYLRGNRQFDEMDRGLLEILTNNVALAVETIEKNKIQESLETARKIQQSMLPHAFEEVAQAFAADIHAALAAAKEVGGDLYDVFAIDADHLCIAVGDVSDKGVPAALFMAVAKTLIRSHAERSRIPSEILGRVNNDLARDNEHCMFVTLFLAVLDRNTGVLDYANGGHNPPYVLRAGQPAERFPPAPGIALGVFEGADYQGQAIHLSPGDGVFLYSDGVTEAEDTQGILFSEARLVALLDACPDCGAEGVTDAVMREVRAFAKGAGQSDDITVLFLRLVGDPA